MAYNGSGLFLINSTGQPVSATTLIESSVFNAFTADVATGLSNCVTKDGQTTVTANLPMASFRHTGVGNAVARTDYAAAGQVQDGKLNWVDGGGTADAITATYSPTITALVDGQLCFVRATAANATTTPTFAPNGLTARTIVKKGGSALAAGDIVADGHELILRYDLANTRWELLNPGSYSSLGANIFTGLQTWKASADIAAAATVDLTAATGNTTRITGTTATSAFTMTAGQWHMCIADGAWPLTYHATTNKLNTGGANYTCAAGDRVLLHKDNSNIVQATILPTSGSIPLSIIDAAGDLIVGTAADTAGRLAMGTGLQQLRVNAGATALEWAAASGITLGTPQASTSGTSIDFTGIPATAKRIIINGIGVSTNGTGFLACQLGDAGGVEATGYLSDCVRITATANNNQSTTLFRLSGNASQSATDVWTFKIQLDLENASNNTWTISSVMVLASAAEVHLGGGYKATSASLDRVRITTSNGTDTFDAGEINIAYE